MGSFVRGMNWLAVGLLAANGMAGCGSDSPSGPASEFVASDPVVIYDEPPFPGCDDDLEKADHQNEPWIAVNPDNSDHQIAMWQADWGRGFISSVTTDGGATWESAPVPGLSRCTGGSTPSVSDPWLTFASNGDVYGVALGHPGRTDTTTSNIVVYKSVDGGTTWSEPKTISETERPAGEDKPSIAADPVDECTVYLGWTRFLNETDLEGEVFFSRTTDCGETWSEPLKLYSSRPAGMAFQSVVSPDGTLLAFFHLTGFGPTVPRPLFVMRSSDRGLTWSEPAMVAEFLQVNPITQDGAQRVRSAAPAFDVAIDRATGRIVLVWEQLSQGGLIPLRIVLSESVDGGATWSDAIHVDQTPSNSELILEQAFVPSVEVSDDGTIGITYYNFQNDVAGDSRADTDHWFIHCHPELADCLERESWVDPVRLTGESFDMLTAIPANRGLFVGDYTGLASSGSDFFSVFAVTRPGDKQNTLFVSIDGR